ncbi:hypothetical protein [Nostoc commune]|uniref:hypothetical protein n=1 Tax=Nostoc commune TaxID=1178 RepID=UPI0020732BAF|nr:hypothetical protein [Nostoc commune]
MMRKWGIENWESEKFPVLQTRDYIHNGPPPAIRAVNNPGDEAELLVRFCKSKAKFANKVTGIGLLACF